MNSNSSHSTISRLDTAVGERVREKLSDQRTLEALERLLDRVGTLEKAVDKLDVLLAQSPGIMAMLSDTVDESCREAAASGMDIDTRLKNAGYIMEQITSSEMIAKLDQLNRLADQWPGLVAMVADTADEEFRRIMDGGFSPQAWIDVGGTVHAALNAAHAAPPAKIGGIFSLLRALREPDTQRGLGFLLNFLKYFGQNLEKK